MSSRYTTVSSHEWEQMQNAVQKADAFQISSQAELDRLHAIEAQQRSELEKIRRETEAAISATQDFLTTSFQNLASKLNSQARAQLNRQEWKLTELRAAAADLNAQTQSAAKAINQLAEDYGKAAAALLDNLPQEEKRAQATLEQLDQMLERLRAMQPVGQARDALQSLESLRATAASNLASGDYQAALLVTQGSIQNASRALAAAMVERERYHAELSKVQDDLLALQSKISFLGSKEGILSYEIGGEGYACEYDINFWSHGIFERLKQQAEELGAAIRQAAETPVPANRLADLSRRIQTVQARLCACDKEARRDFAGALALENTIQRLYCGLEARGWSIESSGHQDEDSRKPYAMTCTDGAGNTVSIVGASGECPETPSFFYEAFAETEGMSDLVKSSIAATLETEGLHIESDVARSDCGQMTSPDAFLHQISLETERSSTLRQSAVRHEIERVR